MGIQHIVLINDLMLYLFFAIDQKSIPKIKNDLTEFITILIKKYFSEGVEGEGEEEKICTIGIDFFEIK